MPYITSNERESREEGRQEGEMKALHESVLDSLEVRFGEVPVGVLELVKASRDIAQLKQWHRLAVTSPTLVEFERALRK